MDNFRVGAEFSSFEEMKSAMEAYENATFSQFYVRDSRSIASSRARAPKKKFKEDLKYSYITYACIAGGKKFMSRSTGVRPNQRTFRIDCPAGAKFTVSRPDGAALTLVALNENHNHERNKVAYSHLPRQRRIAPMETREAVKLLKMQCNRKLVQNHLQMITNKVVTARDLINIKQKYMALEKEENTGQAIVEKLRQIKDSTTELLVDDQDNLLGIYYQDKTMKSAYADFPEIVFIDTTYKLDNNKMPLYLLLGEDSNGLNVIFATFVIANEEESTITKMIQIFKNANPVWEDTVTILSDKDFTEREVLGKEFPHARLEICLFHVFRSMKREITQEKMGISSDQRSLCLELIEKMVGAKTEEEYQTYFQCLEMTGIENVIRYFEENWHEIHHEWVEGLMSSNLTFLNRTSNRLEYLNQKLKEVCAKKKTLAQFFNDFLIFLDTNRQSQEHKIMNFFQKRPVSMSNPESAENQQYMEILTPYAFKFVKQQLSLMSSVKNILKVNGRYVISSKTVKLNVTPTFCDCSFRSSMLLPCRHIFAVRQMEGINLFDHSLCATRWTLQYYKHRHGMVDKKQIEPPFGSPKKETETEMSVELSQEQKYIKSFQISNKIATIVSELPMCDFDHKMGLLENVLDCLKNGIEFNIEKMCDDVTTVAVKIETD